MTPLPKRRHSTRRQGIRRAGLKIATPSFGLCPNCGSAIASHSVCQNCGMYKGKLIIQKKKPDEKRARSSTS